MENCAIRSFSNKMTEYAVKEIYGFGLDSEGKLTYKGKLCELRSVRPKVDGKLVSSRGCADSMKFHFSQLSGRGFVIGVCFKDGAKFYEVQAQDIEFATHHKGLYQADLMYGELKRIGKEIVKVGTKNNK